MWRLYLVPILILGLLVCPLRCAVGAAFGGATRGIASTAAALSTPAIAGCACCAPSAVTTAAAASETGPASRVPVNSAPQDCGCSSCICSGAILPSDADVLSIAPEVGFGAEPSCGLLWHLAAAAEPVARTSADSFSPPGQLLNGRAARIAHQSLLI